MSVGFGALGSGFRSHRVYVLGTLAPASKAAKAVADSLTDPQETSALPNIGT